jgi:hypothetical protein
LLMISLSSSLLPLPPSFFKNFTTYSHLLAWDVNKQATKMTLHKATITFFGCMGICTILLPELIFPSDRLNFKNSVRVFFLCIFLNILCSKEKGFHYSSHIDEAYPNFDVVSQYSIYLFGVI